jgi:SNF2 family DNA or RNA helicase
MGTGKTWIAINFAAAVATREGDRVPRARALVVCPLSVVGVWDQEIAKHDPYADNDLIGVDWRIINYDIVWKPHVYDELVEWLEEFPYEQRLIIADESHRIKTNAARRSVGMMRLARHAPHRVILTGTPITKWPLDLFSQFRFVDDSIFGTTWAQFKRRYATFKPPPAPPNQVKKFLRQKELARKIAPYTFVGPKLDDIIDIPPARHQIVPILMSAQTSTVYTQLANEAIASWQGLDVEAANPLVKVLRLQQITGGWLKGDAGYRRVGKEKLTTYTDLLVDIRADGQEKVVVFCRFLRELKDIALASKQVGYATLTIHGGNRAIRERIYQSFERTTRPTVLICQIGTGALGRNELVVARTAIFYSTDFSFDNFDQALARLWRPGQHHKVLYLHLHMISTVDYTVYTSLREKRDLAHMVLSDPALVYGKESSR